MIQVAYAKIQTELEGLLSDERMQWLQSAIAGIKASQDVVNELLKFSAGARRVLGQDKLTTGAKIEIVGEDVALPISHWNTADAGRALLILQALLSASEQCDLIVRSYFEQGDESEIAIIVRVVNLLKNPERYKFYVREVGRTNSKPLYAALAQLNPYPARYYDDHEFNQLVLKALFIGIGIDTVIGLRDRANAELSKMCEDYIDERLAAGRSIPPDIWLALEPFASENGINLIQRHLHAETPEHRYFSAKALRQQNPLSTERKFWLKECLEQETDPRIIALLSAN